MKHTSKSEVYFGRAETIYLIDQEAQSAAFLEVNVKGFLKKGGEKIKMESQKPCKYRLRDSERLLLILGRKVSGTQRSDKRLAL